MGDLAVQSHHCISKKKKEPNIILMEIIVLLHVGIVRSNCALIQEMKIFSAPWLVVY